MKLACTKTTAREHISRVDPQVSRTVLGNVLLKGKRFSADGQNIAELYNHESCGDKAVPDCSQDLEPILREEVEIAVASKGKSAGVDNTPVELVQAGGETMIDVLTETEICNRIWRTGERPTQWT